MSESPDIQFLPAHAARRVRWRNDLGWTREIHAEPGPDPEGWQWRISTAEIEQTAAFSRFEDVERELMLLSGDGLTLRFDDGEVADLRPPHARLRFSGDRGLQGEPCGPGVSVLNLMWRPDLVQTATWLRPLVGTMLVFVDPGDCWLVHVLAGQARLARTALPPLERSDTLVLRTGDVRGRHVLDGGGSLLLARLGSKARK